MISYNETSENGSWILIYSKRNVQDNMCHAWFIISQLVRNSICFVFPTETLQEMVVAC